MGQTLEHGIYLPDEGERNCYSGLAANWQLLDGAVGTVAEHTTALAGKAADSDVVHKTGNETISGVKSFLDTNIRFNSSSYVSGTPSANIFYAPILIGGVVNNADKNTFQHNAAIRTTGINDYSIRVYSQANNTLTGVVAETNADASNISFRPIADSTHNLGTSSYQWNNLYAKNYYYNGVAWGLDKANTWSADNIYTYALSLKQTNLEKGELPASNQTRRYRFTDKNNAVLGWLQHRVGTSGDSYLECLVANKFSNGQLSTQGSEIINSIVLGLHSDGSRYLNVLGDVYPDLPTRVCNLGTSTNKWKTLNGINPGALSLPNMNATGVDISSYIVYPTGETSLNLSGGSNKYTASENGWLVIVKAVTACRYIKTVIKTRLGAVTVPAASMSGSVYHCQPVPAGQTVSIVLDCDSAPGLYFYPCLGNV